ncbi:hypothetical protein GCM10016272_02220 [Psychrobacter glaciei]|uniref:DUF3149 domain-containing protein n=1 Tax=Psychrobacter glaciei TaxID=619771 RepID=A0ABQ3GLW2_9GAMM|nr:hypothetical protein GCM10016272_02220 [Psychrobacter glaciei]
MTYSFDIPIDTVFFLFFLLGFVVGCATLFMIVDYTRSRAKYLEEHNCMGIRKPNPNRTPMPLPRKPKK